jgi:hypothetical protein
VYLKTKESFMKQLSLTLVLGLMLFTATIAKPSHAQVLGGGGQTAYRQVFLPCNWYGQPGYWGTCMRSDFGSCSQLIDCQ